MVCFRLFAVWVALVSASVIGVLAQGSEEYLDLMGRADEAAAGENYALADSLLSEALRLEPGNPGNVLLINNLGMIRHYMGRDDEAVDALNAACEMAPKSVTVLSNRARVLSDIGRFDEAYADYCRIIELDSMLTEPRFYRAMLALRQGDLAVAEADMSVMNSLAPDTEHTLLGNATLAVASGRIDDAIVAYGRLVRVKPAADYYAMRAELLLRRGEWQDAADDIANGLALAPDDAGLYLLRALLNKARYRPDDAKLDAQRAIELGADREQVERLVGI